MQLLFHLVTPAPCHLVSFKNGAGGTTTQAESTSCSALLRPGVGARTVLSLALAAASTDLAVQVFPDPSGLVQTLSTTGTLDESGPFFQDLGTNGRSCASCHQARDGWSVAPRHLQERFLVSDGMDPVFRPVDGAVCPSADVGSLAARHAAYAMLLGKGLIRVSLPVPDSADFVVTEAADPHACPETTTSQLALFRRPLPAQRCTRARADSRLRGSAPDSRGH